MITLKHNEVPDIPGWLFKCPKCGDLLTCEIDEWEQMDDDIRAEIVEGWREMINTAIRAEFKEE